jgi:hypothetical protein
MLYQLQRAQKKKRLLALVVLSLLALPVQQYKY